MSRFSVAEGVAWRMLHNFFHNKALLIPSLVFPLFFFTAFAGGLSGIQHTPGFSFAGGYTAFQFVFVLLQSAAFAGDFTGFGIARDFESGFARRLMLAAPHRSGIVIGYGAAALVRWFTTASLLTVIALIFQMKVGGDGVDLVGLYTLGVIINITATLWAAGVAMRLRSMQAGPIMQMPVFLILFFAPVYVPLSLLHGWIHGVAVLNPPDPSPRSRPRFHRRQPDPGGRGLPRSSRARRAVLRLGDPRSPARGGGGMILEQYYLGCLAHASYLVADSETGSAAVIDPQRDIDAYVTDAARLGVRIEHVVLTHLPCRFPGRASGAARPGRSEDLPRCPRRGGVRVHPSRRRRRARAGRRAAGRSRPPATRPNRSRCSSTTLSAGADRPQAVLTGDTLFIGDVGRPDLRASLGWTADELGSLLYDSITEKLLPLPDETLVYPAHGAGSLCGKHLSTDTVSTIGIQRRYNYALQPMSREEFIAVVTGDQPDSPAYFTYDAVLNAKERPTLDTALAGGANALSLDTVLELVAGAAQLLDARPSADFAGAHLRGAVDIGLDGSYATWAGDAARADRPIVLVAAPGREEEAAVRLARIPGSTTSPGTSTAACSRSPAAPTSSSGRSGSLPRHSQSSSAEPDPPLVVDVRTADEHEGVSVEGSLNVPLGHLRERLDELPADRRIVVHCGSGYRSAIAASILQAEGFTQVSDLVGGLTRAIETPSARAA